MNLSDEFIKKLKDSPDFVQLQAYIISKIAELRDGNENLLTLSDSLAGEEIKTNIKAAKKLEEILSPFVDYREKKEPTEEEINKAKSKAGLKGGGIVTKIGKTKLRMSSGEIRTFRSEAARDRFERVAQAV